MRLRRGLNESGEKRTVCRVVQRQCHETLIMSQFHLQLRVDAPGSDGGRLAHALTEASQRVRASFYRRLGLKVHSNAWVTIVLGSDAGAAPSRQFLRSAGGECCRGFGDGVRAFGRGGDRGRRLVLRDDEDRGPELLPMGRLPLVRARHRGRPACQEPHVRVGGVRPGVRALGTAGAVVSSMPEPRP